MDQLFSLLGLLLNFIQAAGLFLKRQGKFSSKSLECRETTTRFSASRRGVSFQRKSKVTRKRTSSRD